MNAHTAGQLHEQLDRAVRAAMTRASDADDDAIRALLKELAGTLDERTLTFLELARRLVLATTVALSSVIDGHRGRPGPDESMMCSGCGTRGWPCRTLRRISDVLALYVHRTYEPVDRVEAWRRADRYFSTASRAYDNVLLRIEDFGDGFIARPVSVDFPPPTAAVTPGSDTVLVVDKATGHLSRWPLMAPTIFAARYAEYLRGEPMYLDHPAV